MKLACALGVALALAGCRGDHKAAPASNTPGAAHAPERVAAPSALVPTLPLSPDGVTELHALDKRIEIHKADFDPTLELTALTLREAARGLVEDYQAALAVTADWVKRSPNDDSWSARAHALAAVHDFAGAREALAHVSAQAAEPEQTSIDEATGRRDRSLPARAAAAAAFPNAVSLTQYAAALALAGKLDDARALIPKAAKLVRDNPAELFSWLFFQWGRVYEQAGDLASARAFYEESRRRMQNVEVTAHLVACQLATGDKSEARRTVEQALATDRHPSILELAVPMNLATVDEAKATWERYVAALPLAFADHAARFYLGVGANPARAVELAKKNLANRDTPEARSLVVEAALAANDPAAACAAVDPLVTAPLHADRFVAWKALSRCGRAADAERLARDLGIGK